jgi:hypothetical protein
MNEVPGDTLICSASKSEMSMDVSTDDSLDCSSSASSRCVDSLSVSQIKQNTDGISCTNEIDNDLISRYRVRPSSIDSMSVCGWQFLKGERKPRWSCSRPKVAHRRPKALYVDDKSQMELVSDVRTLRRGDHCVIVLNVFRTINPTLDYLHSWLSGYGYFRMFHHFLVLDDVAEIDSHGVPRNENGIAVEILEYSNTASQFLEEASKRGFIANLLDKAKCRRVALIDYGDNQYFYRFHDPQLTPEKREVIVERALKFMESQPRYHVLFQNCEHTTNLITMKGNHERSALVEYVFSSMYRYVVHILVTVAGMTLFPHPTLLLSGLNVGVIQKHMIDRMKKSGLVEIYRFGFVSVGSFWTIKSILDSIDTRNIASILFGSTLVSMSYWLSDGLLWNTLVNVRALVSHYRQELIKNTCRK